MQYKVSPKVVQDVQSIPNFDNTAVLRSEQLIGPFIYDQNTVDGISVVKKGPVLLEDGSYYEGQWNGND